MPDDSHALDFLANLPGAASAKSKPRAVEEPAVSCAKEQGVARITSSVVRVTARKTTPKRK
jgi:hypothetical protein